MEVWGRSTKEVVKLRKYINGLKKAMLLFYKRILKAREHVLNCIFSQRYSLILFGRKREKKKMEI